MDTIFEFLAKGGNSKVYHGTWNLLLASTNIVLKAISDSDNDILHEVKEKF